MNAQPTFVENVDQTIQLVIVPVNIVEREWQESLPFLRTFMEQVRTAMDNDKVPASLSTYVQYAAKQSGAVDTKRFGFLREWHSKNPEHSKALLHALVQRKFREDVNMATFLYKFIILGVLHGTLEEEQKKEPDFPGDHQI